MCHVLKLLNITNDNLNQIDNQQNTNNDISELKRMIKLLNYEEINTLSPLKLCS